MEDEKHEQPADDGELDVEDLDLDETDAEAVKGGAGPGGAYDNALIAPPLKQH